MASAPYHGRLVASSCGEEEESGSIGFNDIPWNSLDDSCDADHGWPDGVRDADWTIYTGPCLQVEVQRHRDNLSAVFAELRELRRGKRTLIRLAAQYNDAIRGNA